MINELVNDLNNFYQTLLETALPLQQMMAKTLNNLNDDTINTIEQVNSISIHLLTLVSMLIDGQGISNKQFSQPTLTIAQLIQTNFGKNKNYDKQQSGKIKKKRYSCSSILTLKIKGTFRSKTVIDHFFNFGLCHHMIAFFNLLKNYDAQIENYEIIDVFCLIHEGNQYLQ